MESTSTTLQPGDRGPGVRVCAILMIIASTVAVVGRIWHRIVEKNLWWDDVTVLLTLVFSNGLQALTIWETYEGFGRHASAIPEKNLTGMLDGQIAIAAVYATSITCLKLSALTFFAHIFKINQTFRRVFWVMSLVIVLWGIILQIEPWTQCRPAIKFVRPFTPGHCQNSYAWNLVQTLINLLLDLTILLLPMPIIWKLHMSLRRKLQVTLVFAIGYCSAFISMGRFGIIAADPELLSSQANHDLTWDLVPFFTLTIIETPIGLIAVCMSPCFMLLMRGWRFGLPSLFSSTSSELLHNRLQVHRRDNEFDLTRTLTLGSRSGKNLDSHVRSFENSNFNTSGEQHDIVGNDIDPKSSSIDDEGFR